MEFEFLTASRIIFGAGKFNSIGTIVQDYGKRALIVHGGNHSTVNRLMYALKNKGIFCTSTRISHEPTIEMIRMLVNIAKQSSSDFVIGIGGGSAIDAAKAASVMLTNPGDITDYLEVIGQNKPLLLAGIPLVAIPTSAGTGAEVTKNAVLGSTQHHVKVSLRSPYLLPKVSLIDPELTVSLPPFPTAYTGLDALTQLIEAYTCNIPNPITDALCTAGIKYVGKSLHQAYDNGNDLKARENMSLASLFSGIALTNARLGAVHGLAGPLGGEISAPHGAICGCLLPHVIKENIKALSNINPNHPMISRYKVVSSLLSGSASPEALVKWISDFCTKAKIPPLSNYGLSESIFNKVIEKALVSSSMKGNPIRLSDIELRNILEKALNLPQ